jgi:hypothetical protein
MRNPKAPYDDPTPSRDESRSVTESNDLAERRHVIAEYIGSIREFLKAMRNKLN